MWAFAVLSEDYCAQEGLFNYDYAQARIQMYFYVQKQIYDRANI